MDSYKMLRDAGHTSTSFHGYLSGADLVADASRPRDYLPSMPADFIPDKITVTGMYQGVAVEFTLTKDEKLADLPEMVAALCKRLWQMVALRTPSTEKR